MQAAWLMVGVSGVVISFENMPKSVDIYVLETKIGQGQFGDVFRGYSKVDGIDVAIKAMRRDKIRGKFTELLENEIQVLRSCRNNNIVQLIDIKKTANNIYLVLEYCNEGDLLHYVKGRKKLPQEEAVEYFVQILHAFQTLVKSKIMHRDFKLANVLKHDGYIKVADFGFSKLLGTQDQMVETILGSPLNMAPEVLDHKKYNSKADIWSIGVAFYEMIFGKVPYTAGNIIDLLKKIKKDPVVFPLKVHPHVEDVIRRMLTVDPAKRIEWSELFKHPVTRLLEDNLEETMRQSMICKKEELPLNMSKFYIKTNKVVENLHDINTKKELNKYIKEVINSKEKAPYSGAYIKRKDEREDKENINVEMAPPKTEKELNFDDDGQGSKPSEQAAEIARVERAKRSCKAILHHRNTYAFYGHLAQDLIETHLNSYYQCLGFLLVKRAITQIASLREAIRKREVKGVAGWEEFETSREFRETMEFVASEEEIFNRFYEKLSLKVLEEGTLEEFEDDLMISGKFTIEETNQRIYERVLRAYLDRVLKQHKDPPLNVAVQILKLMDSLRGDLKFSQADFDFAEYYEQFGETDCQVLRETGRVKALKFVQEAK